MGGGVGGGVADCRCQCPHRVQISRISVEVSRSRDVTINQMLVEQGMITIKSILSLFSLFFYSSEMSSPVSVSPVEQLSVRSLATLFLMNFFALSITGS